VWGEWWEYEDVVWTGGRGGDGVWSCVCGSLRDGCGIVSLRDVNFVPADKIAILFFGLNWLYDICRWDSNVFCPYPVRFSRRAFDRSLDAT